MMSVPRLPDRELLAELCLETAASEGGLPFAVEKDFYLTRLIWALAQELGDRLLLKGGTLLSKVDLGYRRMHRSGIRRAVRPRRHAGQVRRGIRAGSTLTKAHRTYWRNKFGPSTWWPDTKRPLALDWARGHFADGAVSG